MLRKKVVIFSRFSGLSTVKEALPADEVEIIEVHWGIKHRGEVKDWPREVKNALNTLKDEARAADIIYYIDGDFDIMEQTRVYEDVVKTHEHAIGTRDMEKINHYVVEVNPVPDLTPNPTPRNPDGSINFEQIKPSIQGAMNYFRETGEKISALQSQFKHRARHLTGLTQLAEIYQKPVAAPKVVEAPIEKPGIGAKLKAFLGKGKPVPASSATRADADKGKSPFDKKH